MHILNFVVLDSSHHVSSCRVERGMKTEEGMKMEKAKSTYTVSYERLWRAAIGHCCLSHWPEMRLRYPYLHGRLAIPSLFWAIMRSAKNSITMEEEESRYMGATSSVQCLFTNSFTILLFTFTVIQVFIYVFLIEECINNKSLSFILKVNVPRISSIPPVCSIEAITIKPLSISF